jgi:hypothetical protein
MRVLAWILLALAVAVIGRDVVLLIETGRFPVATLGELWYAIDRGSLNLVQAVIERYLHPWLWDPVVFSLLRWPAALVLGVPGLALAVIARGRVAHGRRRRRAGPFQ